MVTLLTVALPSPRNTTEGSREPLFGPSDSPAALVWQLKRFSGRAVLFDTLSSSAAAASAASLPPFARAAAAAADQEKRQLFSSFLSPVNEFDEESARLGVEPFSSLAADTVAALSSSSSSSASSSSSSSGSSSLPPGLWHLDRLDARSLPLDGSPFDPSTAAFPRKGEGVTIYVVDSGVSVGHSEFLEGGGGESGRRASEGPDFSDAAVVAAVARGDTNLLSTFSSSSNSSSSSSPALLVGDCDGHGTHVASLAAGKNFGVAPRSRVVSLRVLGCDGAGRASGLVAALRFVAREGARPAVVVLSLGGGGAGSGVVRGGSLGASSSSSSSERTAEAIDAAALEALEAGAVVVAAAGNAAADACASSPGRLPGIITVAGSDLPLRDKFPRWFIKDRTTTRKTEKKASPTVVPDAKRSDGGGGGGALGQILSESSSSSSASPRRGLLAEGGEDSKDLLYPYTNTGPCVTLFAPGADLLAACGGGGGTGAGKRRCPDPSLPFAAAWSSGTSMSAPLVAGAAALVLGERPGATPTEVKAELLSRATEGVLDFASKKTGVLPGTPNKLLYLGPV